jgi:aminoglycoside 6'-N-acetyltransferase I
MTDSVHIRPAQPSDRNALVAMRVSLWPESSVEEQSVEVDAWLNGGASGTLPLVLLLAEDSTGVTTGFLEVGLRSHADGCDTAQPVGYVKAGSCTKHRVDEA